MPYLLGVITDEKIYNGIYTPDYVLHRTKSRDRRIPLRILRDKIVRESVLIFPTMTGNDEYIEYMSYVRTRNTAYEKERRKANDLKYVIKGWLCWFSCDRYGKTTGQITLIKHIPDPDAKHSVDERRARLLQVSADKKSVKRLLTDQSDCIDALPNKSKKQYPQ